MKKNTILIFSLLAMLLAAGFYLVLRKKQDSVPSSGQNPDAGPDVSFPPMGTAQTAGTQTAPTTTKPSTEFSWTVNTSATTRNNVQLQNNFQPFTGRITGVNSYANVRQSPSTSAKIVGRATLGDSVFVSGRADNGSSFKGSTVWYATNKGGWIHSKLIKKV